MSSEKWQVRKVQLFMESIYIHIKSSARGVSQPAATRLEPKVHQYGQKRFSTATSLYKA